MLILAGCSPPDNHVVVTAAATSTRLPVTASVEALEPDPSTSELPYPGPNPQAQPESAAAPDPYPAPTLETGNGEQAAATASSEVFMPVTGGSSADETSDDPGETPTAMPEPTPIPTVDFASARENLRANGKDLGYVKIGFHVTLLEDRDVLDGWMKQLDEAGIPLFLKAVDNAEPLFRAQELMKVSGVPHTLIYRSTGGEPLYELPPEQAAQIHWQYHRDKFPPELDPNLVWIETLNEPDRTKAEWFGQFGLEMARLVNAEGFKWAAFGWASGEPEPEQWKTPSMLAFLKLAGENPDQLAIALHEYSFLKEDVAHEYPFKVGRFQDLFRIADEQGFPRPTVMITEWGWEHNNIPAVDQAMRDINWASQLYAPYPEVKGAGTWNLGIGCCFGDISEQVHEIIDPLTQYSLTHYFEIPLPPAKQAINPEQFRP